RRGAGHSLDRRLVGGGVEAARLGPLELVGQVLAGGELVAPGAASVERSRRTAAPLNVWAWTPGNPRAASRSRISLAALSVKVTTSTWPGWTAPVAMAYATRREITRVLPLPAPARMHNGPTVVETASRCAGFRSWVRNLGCTAGRVCHTPPTFQPAIHHRDRL